MLKSVSATSNTLGREFAGVLKESGERVSVNLQKTTGGMLNSVKINKENTPVYSYSYTKGLDTDYFKEKMNTFCGKIKDGAKLFEEIMKYGLNIK